MTYSRINNLTGWFCFLIALVTYILTLEPNMSFWDAGEFIAAAHKMQIVHQPGAPLFLMIEKFFSLLALGDETRVAYFMNLGSALASAFTILFLCWTITALARKLLVNRRSAPGREQTLMIMAAGIVGAVAYTFSDSFWFSAVESEVYALSSLFTAIVFWAMLKWEAAADEPGSDRWLLFIAYMMGLSIGIHLLNLLTIPALAFIYYFRKTVQPSRTGMLKTLIIGIVILAVIQYGIIQYLVAFGAYFDLFFVNTLGMGFGTGVIVFALLLIGGLVYAIRYSIRTRKRLLNLGLLAASLLIFGYCSFAMIVIRAQANPNLNNNDPDNAFSFLGYLNREQYGDRPLLSGPNYNSQITEVKETSTLYRKGPERYEPAGKKIVYGYDRTTLLPRMHGDRNGHPDFYKEWMRFDDSHFPTLIDNIGFLFSYQIGHMYFRYFLWNFVGRQNDTQGFGNYFEGNWLSGIKFVDGLRLGNQEHLPPSITENNGYNRFYFLPLILGIIGMVWHFKRRKDDAGIVALLFFFTGIAIVLYLNQTPLEPRERDYAFSGSFYAFCIWIGLGVLALWQWLGKKLNGRLAGLSAIVLGLLAAPVLMAAEGWDDHDRSGRLVAHDLSKNYLESLAPNAILFTYGDNDTYPLWYIQEVEGIRPDVRLVNLSLFDAEWYINGMKRPQNASAPLPISMKETQYAKGTRDVMYFQDYKIAGDVELKTIVDLLLSDNPDDKLQLQDGTWENFLPTKNFKLTVDRAAALKHKAVTPKDSSRLAPALTWTYNKGFVTKGTLAMLDMLVQNNWERPIYFTAGMPPEQFNGLNNYLYNEGLVLRLTPLQPDTARQRPLTNPDALFDNLNSKFMFGNLKAAKYIDPESRRQVSNLTNIFNTAISGLLDEGKPEKARILLKKYFEVMPEDIQSMYTAGGKTMLAENMYALNDAKGAAAMIRQTADYIEKELIYVADVCTSKNSFVGGQETQLAFSLWNQMIQTAKINHDDVLAAELEQRYKGLEARFSAFFGT
ncbi:DUF2723 domain-containing protein [Pedobacter sp. SAFR-022]|uniref:DUF2723 domain-containing protein n=1 Tax=Pedobacter sp. SAFR-022 TaxID=3436861 RepID=UPI003F7E9C52